MRDWRSVAGALCIVLAMVLGVFAGLVYAKPGLVGASPDVGTRAEDRRLMSAFDETQTAIAPDDALALSDASDPGPTSILGAQPSVVTSPDGVTAQRLTPEEQKDAFAQSVAHRQVTKDGTVTVAPTRTVGTRSHLDGTFDAGGPYGGPDTFEGTDLTIEVTVFDPQVLFFRYDFNGDGVWDLPDQTGGGTLGLWTTQTTITHRFNDNVFGQLLVQGWDGISTFVVFNTGDNLGEVESFSWFIGYGEWNFAWQFRAKSDLRVTELGHYHYVYNIYETALWDTNGNLLGSCEAVHNYFSWNWCTLPSPVDLALGAEYRIAVRIDSWTTAIDTPPDTDKVQFEGTYYCYGYGSLCFPDSFWVDFFIPQIDFRWEETLLLPDAAMDGADIQVMNVAPTVFDVMTNPSPGLEGSPTEFTASFDDPGLDDTWEYRWIFHDGEVSDWRSVSKYSGGARVLILHSWTGDIGGIRTNIMTACGTFCLSVDEMDFGPLGQNRIPDLDELTPYDVLVVGTNWGPIPNSNSMGDRLAEFMDAAGPTGGGIVMMSFGFYSNTIWGIGGRWETEKSPLPRGGSQFFNANLGTVYVPGHPFLDGVASVTAFYRQPLFDVTDGATRVADWTDGTVLAAEKADSGGRLACGLNYFPSLSVSGDYARVIANAIRYCSRQADPVLKTMPIQLDVLRKTYKDDEPTTTTPEDSFPVTVEVRDDDHLKVMVTAQDELFFNDFENPSECSGYWGGSSNWPAGWSADPDGYGWVCGDLWYIFGSSGPDIFYYYNDPNYGTGDGNSYLYTNTYDLSGYTGARIEFNTWWQGDYPFGTSDGYVQVSTDGGASFTDLLAYHHNDPSSYTGPVTIETTAIGGFSDVVFRFYYLSSDDWWWYIDDFHVTGIVGEVMWGLGTADGVATIANVPPTVVGGFDNALRDEAQGLDFKGYRISDPALIEPTEWFAYAWNFDDGTPTEWVYKGSLAPPKLNILLIHTLVLSGCSSYCANLRNTLLAQDDVGSVDTFNFINYPNLPSAPSLNTMLQYDVIIVATNWAYISYPPFDLARRQVGDRLAQYIDAGRGGVLTMMAVYDLSSFFGDIFSINGRYMDEDYGAFERTEYGFSPGAGINILDPESDLFVGMNGDVNSAFISPGNMPLTVGGQNNAAGHNGVKLATWKNTGNPAVGAKTLNNGIRTVHIGAFGEPSGAEIGQLLRNSVGFASVDGIPSPKIPAFSHTWGDNGVYTVDVMAIDDDMGYLWDFAANEPMVAIPGVDLSHRYIEVAVNNVEPTIAPDSIQAFIAAQVCVRISGTEGNSVTAEFYTDGVLSSTTTVTRLSGSPNPTDEKCGLLKVDVLAVHDFSADLTYSAPAGGSNPTWLVIAPWREPISPGHGTVTYKFDFAGAGTQSLPLPTLKQDLVAGGQGAKIDFVAEAYDPGNDDLAFFWAWAGEASRIYDLTAQSDYSIHVHHNDGTATTAGALADPQYLGFSEPYFDRDANTGRSPLGATDLRIRDTATHAFAGGQTLYYVFLLVVDDDVGRGYPSLQNFGLDGMDIDVLVVNLG